MASSDTSNTEFAYLGQVLGWDTMEKWLETKKEDESIGQLASIASLFGTEETKLWIRERFSGIDAPPVSSREFAASEGHVRERDAPSFHHASSAPPSPVHPHSLVPPIRHGEIYHSCMPEQISTLPEEHRYFHPLAVAPISSFFTREHKRCLQNGELFVDISFPADDTSLCLKPRHRTDHRTLRDDSQAQWRRCIDVCSTPLFFPLAAIPTRFDTQQSLSLGNCWFVSALAVLSLRPELVYRVALPAQSFTHEYAGIFRFRFWRYGKWVEVIVDDFIPVDVYAIDEDDIDPYDILDEVEEFFPEHSERIAHFAPQTGITPHTMRQTIVPMHMHSRSGNVFWAALLEKAYAKMYGCYDSLNGGFSVDALEDLTGGMGQSIAIDKDISRTHLAEYLLSSFRMGSLICCSKNACLLPEDSAYADNGLVYNHAYAVTAVYLVTVPPTSSAGISSGCVSTLLLRFRNPWGTREWNGSWSDRSSEWKSLPSYVLHDCLEGGPTNSVDGEFWMCYEDFATQFTNVEICHLNVDIWDDLCQAAIKRQHSLKQSTSLPSSPRRKVSCKAKQRMAVDTSALRCSTFVWRSYTADKIWDDWAETAGGFYSSAESSYHRNPQFLFHIIADTDNTRAPECTVFISLLQKYRRELMRQYGFRVSNNSIGFELYNVVLDDCEKPLAKLPLSCQTLKDLILCDDMSSSLRLLTRCDPNPPPLRPQNYTQLRTITSRFILSPGAYIVIPYMAHPGREGDFILRVLTNGTVNENVIRRIQ